MGKSNAKKRIGTIEPPKGGMLVNLSDKDGVKLVLDEEDMRKDVIHAKMERAANFWKTDEAKEKPWLTKVPPYAMGFGYGDNFENFVDDRIKELLSEIDYKTWESKDRTFNYEWTFDGFQVYQECSRSLQSYSIDLFEEQDAEIRNLILECIFLYKQVWHARHTSQIATHGEYKDDEEYSTMCKVGVGRQLFDAHKYAEKCSNELPNDDIINEDEFKRLLGSLKKFIKMDTEE